MKTWAKERFAWLPVLTHGVRSLRGEVRSVVRQERSRRALLQRVARGEELHVEVGAGAHAGRDGWLTVDLNEGCDVHWDLRRGLPFPDGSVATVYSSHFLEHLTFKEGQHFLVEARRVLREGGGFSICVPDARPYVESYMGLRELDAARFFAHREAFNLTSRIDHLNHVAYMDGHHKYMFDAENLVCVLERAGFRDARLREFDPTLDLEARHDNSIYAAAVR